VSAAATSLVILSAVIVVFIWNRLPVGVVAIGAALALYFTGLLDADRMLAGFGDPVVIFIASLFVVAEGIEATGVTAWASRSSVRRCWSVPSSWPCGSVRTSSPAGRPARFPRTSAATRKRSPTTTVRPTASTGSGSVRDPRWSGSHRTARIWRRIRA
jgi:hypothetical protein